MRGTQDFQTGSQPGRTRRNGNATDFSDDFSLILFASTQCTKSSSNWNMNRNKRLACLSACAAAPSSHWFFWIVFRCFLRLGVRELSPTRAHITCGHIATALNVSDSSEFVRAASFSLVCTLQWSWTLNPKRQFEHDRFDACRPLGRPQLEWFS